MAWSVSMGYPKNAYCGRHVSAAVDFRLRAQVRSPRFGPRSRCQELNPGPSYRRNRSRGVRPLGQAGPAGSGWRTLGRVFAGAPLSMARPITSPFVRAEPVIKRSCPLLTKQYNMPQALAQPASPASQPRGKIRLFHRRCEGLIFSKLKCLSFPKCSKTQYTIVSDLKKSYFLIKIKVSILKNDEKTPLRNANPHSTRRFWGTKNGHK